MTKELYKELQQIEDRLYDIAKEDGSIFNGELGNAWESLYTYLEKAKPVYS